MQERECDRQGADDDGWDVGYRGAASISGLVYEQRMKNKRGKHTRRGSVGIYDETERIRK